MDPLTLHNLVHTIEGVGLIVAVLALLGVGGLLRMMRMPRCLRWPIRWVGVREPKRVGRVTSVPQGRIPTDFGALRHREQFPEQYFPDGSNGPR